MSSEMPEWLRKNMRARWPLVNLFIGVAFAVVMLLIERWGRTGGWWPDDFLRQFLLSLAVAGVVVLALGVVVLIARRIRGRVG
jgi:hypothetical protein